MQRFWPPMIHNGTVFSLIPHFKPTVGAAY